MKISHPLVMCAMGKEGGVGVGGWGVGGRGERE